METKDMKALWNHEVYEIPDIKNNREISMNKYYSYSIDHDIKHLGFIFSRYKFAAKMIARKKHINLLELGCNNGMGIKFFEQTGACDHIVGVDFDHDAIKWAKATFASEKIQFIEEDFLSGNYTSILLGGADVIISIDVIEHILKAQEEIFLQTISKNLKNDGIAIIGTPNITMEPYASTASKIGHVNWYNQETLYKSLTQIFSNVFIFGMNDEVIHTGFDPFCCYIMAVCANKISV